MFALFSTLALTRSYASCLLFPPYSSFFSFGFYVIFKISFPNAFTPVSLFLQHFFYLFLFIYISDYIIFILIFVYDPFLSSALCFSSSSYSSYSDYHLRICLRPLLCLHIYPNHSPIILLSLFHILIIYPNVFLVVLA